LLVFFTFIFGLLIGSFLNVVILRAPAGRALSGRSACPHCRRTLTAVDLVPVLSYALLRGRCRACGSRISVRYPIIELCTGVGFALVAWYLAPAAMGAFLFFALCLLVIAVGIVTFVIDFEHYLILDIVTFWGVVMALILQVSRDVAAGQALWLWPNHTLGALAGAAAVAIPLWLLWFLSRGRALGFGDVKFAVFIGATLGFPLALLGVLCAFWVGALFAIPLLLTGRRQLGSKVPFGTFLVVGQILALLWGERLFAWYTHLFI
jgi:prepilin signal peptidase PulO-like enzyme (type II secretory pathway)